MTKIYGHRGSKGTYPENTLLSFQKAIESGVEGLELDVHMTKDGEIVVIHDETLERTTNGAGSIKDLTLAELKQYSTGVKFNTFENYTQSWDEERIPTLQEVLELLKHTNIELNIELKTYIHTYPGIERKLVNIVHEYAGERRVVYSSFHLPSLIRLKQEDNDAQIALLLNQLISNPLDYIGTFDLESIHIDKDLILHDPYHFFKELAPKLRVWTVNEEEEMKKLLQLGVEAIITDYPEMAISLATTVNQ